MLRRVARALRLLLFVLGIVLLAWIPVSLFVIVEAATPRVRVEVDFTSVAVQIIQGDPPRRILHNPGLRLYRQVFGPAPYGLLLPGTMRFNGPDFGMREIRVPLWIVSFLCLAWPVTSFIVARRGRKGRGFEVEAKAGNAVSTSDS